MKLFVRSKYSYFHEMNTFFVYSIFKLKIFLKKMYAIVILCQVQCKLPFFPNRRNPYTRTVFYMLRVSLEKTAEHPNMPNGVKVLIHKLISVVCSLAAQTDSNNIDSFYLFGVPILPLSSHTVTIQTRSVETPVTQRRHLRAAVHTDRPTAALVLCCHDNHSLFGGINVK